MPTAAKGFFTVTAGMIPDQPLPEISRQWSYTSLDYAADRETPHSAVTRFSSMRGQALAYANGLMDPAGLNWVRVEFVWV